MDYSNWQFHSISLDSSIVLRLGNVSIIDDDDRVLSLKTRPCLSYKKILASMVAVAVSHVSSKEYCVTLTVVG